MARIRPRTLAAAAAFLTAATSLPSQTKVPLTKPAAEFAEGFTRVTAIRELPSGKVIVVDQMDKIVQLVDLAAGTAQKIGREGNGPGEYSLPSTVLGLPDGSSLVLDMLNRRLLTISPDGKPGAFLELPRPPATQGGGGGPRMMIGGMDMRGTDLQGRLYYQGAPFSIETGATFDSVAILRWDRVNPKLDTVGYVKLPPSSVQTGGGQGNFRVQIGGQKVFTPAEVWAVAGDGRIARVTPMPYRVIWMDGATKAAGPVQSYTPIKVTEADKELVREARRRQRPMVISMGAGGASSGPPPGGSVQVPEPEFEETMPPFTGGVGTGGSVLATPEGEVWVLRTRPASDKIPSYDVFDRTGALVKKVQLNPNSRVVGFGKGTVYVVRTDDDDLQYLQRYVR